MNVNVSKELKSVKIVIILVASKKFGMKKSNVYPINIIPGNRKEVKKITKNEKRYQ
jgi:hypothetical protein